MNEQTHVTVAVPVLNRREQMLRCLEAILALDYPSFDVLVLDNGSTDGTAEACRARAAQAAVPITVEVHDGNAGHLRNVAARRATGEIIAYTDSDCLPDRGWLRAGIKPFLNPSVGVVTGTTLPEHPGPYDTWWASQTITTQTWRFETCNALFRRAALLATDGFNEQVWTWEDTAAGWAVLRAGWIAEFIPEALVHHDVTAPGFWWHVRRVRRYGEGAVVVQQYPELRRNVLWGRYFQSSRNAKVTAAVIGMLLSPVRRITLLMLLPWLWYRRPRKFTRVHLKWVVQMMLLDLAEHEGMVRGSIRARRLML